ncbi:MAG: sigma-70 family RNA polymerase sigma factor [Vicinamibacterales bacterium]
MATPGGEPVDPIVVVYRETIDPLYRYVSRSCGGDRALAEDVTQETWLRAVRDWRRKGPPEQPIAWLTTVARNLIVTHYRGRRRPAPDSALEGQASTANIEREAEAAQAVTAVHHALSRMPASQAELLETFHFDERATADIADEAGLSERAVEGRLRRARQRLRRELVSLLKINGGPR